MSAITKSKWFWAWNDDKEEAWLREMAAQGLHLVSAGAFGHYTFTQGHPKDVVYRLDFQTGNQKETYLQLFRDAGWEHVCVMSGWQYFRKEVKPGESPEIFTDNQSKVQKYRRVIFFLVAFFPIYTVLFTRMEGWVRYSDFGLVIQLIAVAIFCLYIYCMIKLLQRIKALRKM